MTIRDPLGDRFKAVERANDPRVTNPFAVVRVDGRAFHTLTRHMEHPFDMSFVRAMDNAALAAATVFQNVLLSYVQSDEISIVVERRTAYPFDGRVLKFVSLAASAATGGFNTVLPAADASKPAVFDGRLLPLDDVDAVRDYLSWRRLDAMRNAVNAALSALNPPARLRGLRMGERAALLAGTRFEHIDDKLFRGRIWHPVTFDKQMEDGSTVRRREWRLDVADRTTVDTVLDGVSTTGR